MSLSHEEARPPEPSLSPRARAAIQRAYGSFVNLTADEMERVWKQAHAPLAPVPALPMDSDSLCQLATLQRKRTGELTDEDHRLMGRAATVIRDLLDARPPGDVEHSAWRTRLMLLGHDPLRHRF